MKNLLDTYKRKMRSAQNLLAQLNAPGENEARIRVKSQINCYNYFIFELERLMIQGEREKQRIETQSEIIREIEAFNREMEKKEESNPKYTSGLTNKKLNLFSN